MEISIVEWNIQKSGIAMDGPYGLPYIGVLLAIVGVYRLVLLYNCKSHVSELNPFHFYAGLFKLNQIHQHLQISLLHTSHPPLCY